MDSTTSQPSSSPDTASNQSDEHKGALKKHTLTRHVRFDCERQLLLDIGREDVRWLKDISKLKPAPFRLQSSQTLFDLGKEFEQRVYSRLSHENLYTRAARSSDHSVHTRKMDASRWRALVAEFLETEHDVAILLEHEFDAPHNLLKRWIGMEDFSKPLPIKNPQQQLRPDITLLHQPSTGKPHRAIDHTGQEVIIHQDDERLAISFVDIKYTNRESVGKKHYIELLYYAHAFALFLHEQKLDDLLYVPIHGHGILPQFDAGRTNILTYEDFEDLVEPLVWHDHAHLLNSVQQDLARLWSRAPMHHRDAHAALQPGCVLCPYLGECQHLAGYTPGKTSHPQASIDVLAYTSPGVVEQLRPHEIQTVSDLDGAVIPDPVTPTPLASERPMLSLKAKSLVTGEPAWASDASMGDMRHMSMAIPKYTDSVLTFVAEQDPTNDRVFVYAASLDLRIKDTTDKDGQPVIRPYADLHDRLWTGLAGLVYRPHLNPFDEVMSRIYPDARLIEKIASQNNLTVEQVHDRQRIRVRRMVELLRGLDRDGEVSIDTSKEHQEHVHIQITVGDLNGGHEDIDERRLVRQFVHHAVSIVELVANYEELCPASVTYENRYAKTPEDRIVETLISPSSALFYWSLDQLEHVRDLLERHLLYLMTSDEIYDSFRQLINLVTPSASGIQRHYRNRKLFDLRQFVETTVGLPQIINYTWHETAHQILPNSPRFNRRYWSDHYNYMYFGMWHDALDHGTHADRGQIIEQARRKARVVGQLVRTFQAHARFHDVISSQSYYPMRTREISSHKDDISSSHHFIARAWKLYNLLDASIQQEAVTDQRLTFPLKSIGKLVAAHVTNLTWREVVEGKQTTLVLDFTLEGLSSNVKFKPGAYVLMIHESRRDRRPDTYGKDTVILDEMRWDSELQGYRVSAHVRTHDPRPGKQATIAAHSELSREGWYLYDNSMDVWSSRLARAIDYRQLATSWLGSMRAYLMGLMPADELLDVPESCAFDVAECVMYAPELLPSSQLEDDFELMTPSFPPLDDSKQRALRQVFTHPTSCILGPPGTGKSQAICALIDEFLMRHPNRPLKILVSASSYEPMRVVLDKLQSHRDHEGNPTLAAQIEKVWLHSSTRDPLDRDDIHHFCLDGDNMLLDGQKIERRKKSRLYPDRRWRMDDELPERYILFGVPYQLAQLLKQKKGRGTFLHLEHFEFDLVIVDEASQMPVDQATTLLPLIRRGTLHTQPLDVLEGEEHILDVKILKALKRDRLTRRDGQEMSADSLTRIVFVGDHNQLPPVQQVEPPENLQAILESAFAYFQKHLGVPSTQLQTNYRSLGEIVDYTNALELYEHPIEAFFATHDGIEPLPEPPAYLEPWLRELLAPERVVSTIMHDAQFDTAVSELEAALVCEVVCGFFEQMQPGDATEELTFWSEHIGIVSPHNAHGRLIIRRVYERLLDPLTAPHTWLDGTRLMQALGETIYSVEKFQGSARSFIVASMGISARDQIRAEETFIYDLNRLNVLTSRAVNKMLLVCSNNLLDYVPHTRRMIGPAARLRDYAHRYCNVEQNISFLNQELTMRWHDANHQLTRRHSQPITLPEELLALGRQRDQDISTSNPYNEAALDKMLEELSPEMRAVLMKKLMGGE